MITGTGRCASRSITLPTLQAASTYSGENRPPTLAPKLRTMNTISTSASRNCGVASPVRLTTVSAWSPTEYWWVAAKIPIGIATT